MNTAETITLIIVAGAVAVIGILAWFAKGSGK